jgi:hypothetical protein
MALAASPSLHTVWTDDECLLSARGRSMSTRELQQLLIENLREWQKLENAQIAMADSVRQTAGNVLVSVIMEIIQRDSQMHHKVQQLLIDSLESEIVTLAPKDAKLLRDQLATHLKMEEETVRLARGSLDALAGKGFAVQEFLMEFLHRDEQKHRDLLTTLDVFLTPDDGFD